MKHTILPIDFEIIWKSVHGHLNDQEQLILNTWLHENPKHQQYYLKVKFHFSKKEMNTAKANVDTLWYDINLQEKKNTTKKKRKLLISVAASILMVITSFAVYSTFTTSPDKTATIDVKATNLPPGENKAILHLGNGTTLALGDEMNLDKAEQISRDNLLLIKKQTLHYTDQRQTPSNSPVKTHLLEVPRAGEFMLQLADGTKVWLNSESTLRYPVRFEGDKRIVELTGEAYFEVAHNQAQPFEVISGNQTIRVLGTSFNINSYPEEKEIISTLMEGRISIETKNGSNTILTPGNQSIYNQETQHLTKYESVNTDNYLAWKNGLFYFQNKSLDDIMGVLSRWYDIEVLYQNEEKKKIRFTGTLKRYESFKEISNLIEMTDDVKFIIKGNVIIIE